MYDCAVENVLVERINQALAARDWTPAELARKSGLTPGAISKVLSGKTAAVRSETVARIAAALEVSVDYLQGSTDDPFVSDAEALPEFGLEVLEAMSKLTAAQNYELLTVARALAAEKKQIRHMQLLELLQEVADQIDVGAELDRLQEALMSLEGRRLGRLPAAKDAGQPPSQ